MTTLWHIRRPNRDWYQDQFVNGNVGRRFILPGVECPLCTSWGGSRVLPFECPEALQEQVSVMRQQRGCIPPDEFFQLKECIEQSFEAKGVFVQLLPGDRFMPAEWTVPSSPRYDIFWPFGTIIVSQRVVDTLVGNEVLGASVHRVDLVRVGALDPFDEVPIPENGEYDDEYFARIGCVEDRTSLGNFYELVLEQDTWPKPSTIDLDDVTIEICPKCQRCERNEIIAYKKRIGDLRRRRQLPKRYVCDADAFRSHVFYQGFICTERIKEILCKAMLENCEVSAIEVIEDG